MSNKKQNDPSRREAETQQTRKADGNDTPAGQSAEQETQRPAATIEAFLPTDYFSSDIAAQAAKRRRRLALFAAIVVLVAAIATAGLVYYRRLRQNPSDFLQTPPIRLRRHRLPHRTTPLPRQTSRPRRRPIPFPYWSSRRSLSCRKMWSMSCSSAQTMQRNASPGTARTA